MSVDLLLWAVSAIIVAAIAFASLKRESRVAEQTLKVYGSAEAEQYIRDNLASIAEQQFPDTYNTTFSVISVKHESELIMVEIEPSSAAEVGYPKFILAYKLRESGPPVCEATYCWENEKYSLLSTRTGITTEMPREL